MWKAYGRYKFVFSPWGFGHDCGRSWEIMLMGAIPVIEYFAGAVGYLQGGLSAILVRKPEELTEANLAKWLSKYKKPTEKHQLSRRYWLERVFDGLHGESVVSE
jgi:hypothetical protein